MLIPLLVAGLVLFPNVQARSIDGHEFRTEAWRGQPLAVGLGFSMDSRHQLEDWGQLVTRTGGSFRYVQMPVMKGWLAQLARPMMERALLRRYPPAEHGNFCLTADAAPLEQTLGLGERHEDVIFLLLDAEGRVRFQAHGKPGPEAETQLTRALRELR